jgi:hypothetical protein
MPRGKTQRNRDLIDACHDILTVIQPASVRAVCYQLFTRGLLPSMQKACTDRVSKQLVYAREQGIIPWEWIVDETRKVEKPATWHDPQGFVRDALYSYRRDWWVPQPVRVEVWSEKGTVRGTLAPILDQYAVAFRVLHGFGSATVVHGVSEESLQDPRPLIVFYVGDWDPSGLCMSERDLPQRIARYGGLVRLQRIALTSTDVYASPLPSFEAETKRGDSRYGWFVARYGTQCWELDALNPVVLRQRVESVILGEIDQETWARYEQVERAERDSLVGFLQNWHAAISRQASI